MSNHSLILDKRNMKIALRTIEKYKDVFLLKDDEIKVSKKILIFKPRHSLLFNKIHKKISWEFKKNWKLEKLNLSNDTNYKVNTNDYLKDEIEAMKEKNLLLTSSFYKFEFLYDYPENASYNKNYKTKISENYTIEQRINDLIIFYNNSCDFDYRNEKYSEYAFSFIYDFIKKFSIHEIRAWYWMDNDHVFYWWMKDALNNYDTNVHYDISWNEYKQMCKDVYENEYGAEYKENEYFFFRNC